ncbi:uncharacterized protein LOC120181223 [Hibiscus syriacus]|uniref:uncharacterized protein LOC120181223 n=1 Tax=Hibiscus syriacus TaxID=106335 RepID=UPI00192207D6|nr:uncharacterized protein LOC120181223 [Hibiscus syriacus]
MALNIVESKERYMASYAAEGVPTTKQHLKLHHYPSIPAPTTMLPSKLSSSPVNLIFIPELMTGVDDGLYLHQFPLNQVISAFGIGRVLRSKDEKYREGDIVLSPFLPVVEYCVVPCSALVRKIDPAAGIPLPEYLNCLGNYS